MAILPFSLRVYLFRQWLYIALVSRGGDLMKYTHLQQFLFSGTLIGLTANRLHYTRHLPPGDPLNNGHPFYGLLTFLL